MTALLATRPDTGRIHHVWLVLLLAWPWVQPFSSSPLPHVWPWLISWTCLALALFTWQRLSVAIVVQSWAAAALLSSAMGLVQFLGQAELFAPFLHVPEYLGDAMGNLRQRNQLASLLAMGVLAVLIWRVLGLSIAHSLWMLALLAIGMAATASRTGLLQLVFIGLWMLLHRAAPKGREALLLTGVALGVYALASWLLPELLRHLSGQATNSAMARMGALGGCGSRQALWANVLHLVAQHPLSGWGLDQLRYAHYITEYPSLRFCDMLGNAHNLPLHIAFVWGVPVAVLASLGVLVWVVRAKPWHHQDAGQQLAWGVLGVLALHSLLEYPLWYGPFQVALLLCLWLMRGRVWQVLQEQARALGLALILLGILGFVAYDHAQARQIYLPAAQRYSIWRDQALQVAQRAWLFPGTAVFAQVTTTPLHEGNARAMLEASLVAMRTSPEPRVIEKLLGSAQLLGEDALFEKHKKHFQRVYPQAYLAWAHRQQL
jgi:O-antigen ligase